MATSVSHAQVLPGSLSKEPGLSSMQSTVHRDRPANYALGRNIVYCYVDFKWAVGSKMTPD